MTKSDPARMQSSIELVAVKADKIEVFTQVSVGFFSANRKEKNKFLEIIEDK